MCLAAFALGAHPRFPRVIAANRDEFFARPTRPMAWWPDRPGTLAGRDLAGGGTWFGLNRRGRLALLTNVREPARQRPDAPTRGALVLDWLDSPLAAPDFAATMRSGHNGFNLITADFHSNDWHWLSNRADTPVALRCGLHAISNAALDTPWPKTLGLTTALAEALHAAASSADLVERLLAALADRTPAPDAALPDTGVGLAHERLLSPRCVRMPDPLRPGRALYGTRCSTVFVTEVLANGRHHTQVVERTVDDLGRWGPTVHHEPTLD